MSQRRAIKIVAGLRPAYRCGDERIIIPISWAKTKGSRYKHWVLFNEKRWDLDVEYMERRAGSSRADDGIRQMTIYDVLDETN